MSQHRYNTPADGQASLCSHHLSVCHSIEAMSSPYPSVAILSLLLGEISRTAIIGCR